MKTDNDKEEFNKDFKTDDKNKTSTDLTLEINEKNKIITQTKSYIFDLEKELFSLDKELDSFSKEREYYKNNKFFKMTTISDYIYLLFKSGFNLTLNITLYKTLKNSSLFKVGEYLSNLEQIHENNIKYISPYAHYTCVGFEKKCSFNEDIEECSDKKELMDLMFEYEMEEQFSDK